jgi:hypothetical protein
MFGITLKIVATDSDDTDSDGQSGNQTSSSDDNKGSDIFNA